MEELKDKESIRKSALDLRRQYVASLPPFLADDFCKTIYQNLKPMIQKFKNPCIATYWPMRSEFDIKPLNQELQKEGYDLCFPIVDSFDHLEFYEADDSKPLVKGRFGFLEPVVGTKKCDPSIFLVPMVAFDRHCHRLGYGKGHYDRTLCKARLKHNTLAIGIAYDMQHIDDIPYDPTDQKLDYVLTEKAIYKQ